MNRDQRYHDVLNALTTKPQSQAQIARLTGYSISGVRRALHELNRDGISEMVRNPNGSVSWRVPHPDANRIINAVWPHQQPRAA